MSLRVVAGNSGVAEEACCARFAEDERLIVHSRIDEDNCISLGGKRQSIQRGLDGTGLYCTSSFRQVSLETMKVPSGGLVPS